VRAPIAAPQRLDGSLAVSHRGTLIVTPAGPGRRRPGVTVSPDAALSEEAWRQRHGDAGVLAATAALLVSEAKSSGRGGMLRLTRSPLDCCQRVVGAG